MPARQKLPLQMRIILAIIVAIAFLLIRYYNSVQNPPGPPSGKEADGIVIENETAKNVVVRDEDGGVLYRGDVDLSDTLARIEKRKELDWHENDGEAFGNFEGRLPKKPSGYYHEWVHPTPRLHGAGPQRIITGKDGEKYYSPDHYGHFYLVP